MSRTRHRRPEKADNLTMLKQQISHLEAEMARGKARGERKLTTQRREAKLRRKYDRLHYLEEN